MTDNEYENLKSEIVQYMQTWTERLGLQKYLITTEFVRGGCEDNPECSARTNVFWEYLDAKIVFYLPYMKDSYRSVESIVVHELVHILLAPISANLEPDAYTQQNEFVTETITKTLMNLAD